MDEPHRDQRGALAFLGVVEILIGLACGALLLYTTARPDTAAPSTIFFWGMAAFVFVTTGVGAIRGRRWARAVSVVASAAWMAFGVVATLAVVLVVPKVAPATPLGKTAAQFFVIGVALPAVLFAMFRRDAVRVTCERLDPGRRWTDLVPLPVLGLALLMAFFSLWLLVNLSPPAIPLGGTVLTGGVASLTLLALAILCAVLAVQLARLKLSAWWTVVLLQVIGSLLWGVTLARSGGALGRDPIVWALMLATWGGYLVFLLSLRKYFAGGWSSRPRMVEAT